MSRKIPYILFAVILYIIDQATKILAVNYLKARDPLVLVSGLLELRYVENRGAAFGILQNGRWFFLLVSLAILVAVIYLLRKLPDDPSFLPLKLCLYALSAGAAGNMTDRILHSYVVDFIYFKPIDFPVFNVADIYVTVTAFLLLILFMFYYDEKEMEQVFGGGSEHGKRR